MKRRFLVHSLSHTFVAVDITQLGLSNQVLPKGGQQQPVPSVRFRSWEEAEEYFLSLGVEAGLLKSILMKLKSNGVAVLTIV